MTVHTYHPWYDEDIDKWLVLDEIESFVAGPFSKLEQAVAWIKQQNDIQQGIDA